MKRILWGVFIMVFGLAGLALAGDTQSFPVSCTVPAIPGVNVPLLFQEKEEALPPQAQAKEEIGQEMVRQDSGASSAVGALVSTVMVQTYYAR